jgi:hypothetical protein
MQFMRYYFRLIRDVPIQSLKISLSDKCGNGHYDL